VTSDLSGFGDYILRNIPEHDEYGLHVIERGKRTFEWSANQLMGVMHQFISQSRRERIMQRNNVENNSGIFDWENLIRHYSQAYELALKK
jgi:glycogen(starch) synthase